MFSIVSDTSANLDRSWLKAHDVSVIPFHFFVAGEDRTCMDTEGFDGKKFYDAMRAGEKVVTSQITPQAYLDHLRPMLQAGQDVLFVGMSSGISGSYNQAQAAAAELRGEFPERAIYTVDTLSASLGEGLLVARAVECRDAGDTLEDTYALLQTLRVSMCQVFTVDDLKYLRNTGRLSNMKAMLGMMLNIKPLLKGNEEGKIVSFATVRGRRRSIMAMAERYNSLVRDAGAQTIGIAHADCPADVEYLISLLKAEHPPKDIMTVMYEPVTGSHVGPGTLALFFFGDENFRSQSDSLLSAISQKVDEGKETLLGFAQRRGQKE